MRDAALWVIAVSTAVMAAAAVVAILVLLAAAGRLRRALGELQRIVERLEAEVVPVAAGLRDAARDVSDVVGALRAVGREMGTLLLLGRAAPRFLRLLAGVRAGLAVARAARSLAGRRSSSRRRPSRG